ncbi:DNA polymerase Y family protein [Gordonia phthalatica]|uniref:DNA polymerase n=1 Tax=Gordonia phthalatica TaxID=1136941 RepID=A0A0N9NF13_9ACTN|nr:DNA polymerase Y family protein [Gordonia phthalatica]ALG84198.1 DNA polymerase [Gordonia phthalatica]
MTGGSASDPRGRPSDGRRVLALWCPDWPTTAAAAAAGRSPGEPVAVLRAGRVQACSHAARVDGVRRGMKKRQAQSLCPRLAVYDDDPARDGRLFDPVVAAVTDVVPMTEVLRPGLLVVAADRAARFFGSEEDLAERLSDVVAEVGRSREGDGLGVVVPGGVTARAGVADELYTAVLAARSGQTVPRGADADYLAGRPVSDLVIESSLTGPGRDDLVNLLWRLGIRTLGAFAALDAADVASRFSSDAITAHRLARGLPGRRPSRAPIPADLQVEHVCDPPIERVDAAAFLGRRMAQELHERLSSAALACTRLTVHAFTERGQRHSRTWRCAEPLTPEATVDRIRWQLEGWLTGRGRSSGRGVDEGPDSPIARLVLEPVEVVDPGALQHVLAGAGLPDDVAGGLGDGARRALVRVQGLLGGESVRIPVRSGGRGPAEQVALVAFGDAPQPPRDPAAAWPDRLARPSPSLLTQTDAEMTDAEGNPVVVTARGAFSAPPSMVRVGARRYRVHWWAGPWPFGGGAARAQVLVEDARALLLCYRETAWIVEGVYE